MAECIQCSDFTKFEGGLCLECYKESQDKTSSKAAKKDNSWVFNLIKGRIVETIIEELFLTLSFQVFKYGMEKTIPCIMDEVATAIKRMPDQVVYKDGPAHFIKVKFRASETFKLSDIDKAGDYPYKTH